MKELETILSLEGQPIKEIKSLGEIKNLTEIEIIIGKIKMTIKEVSLIIKTQEMTVVGIRIDMTKKKRTVIRTIEETTVKSLVQEKMMAGEDMIKVEVDLLILRILRILEIKRLG